MQNYANFFAWPYSIGGHSLPMHADFVSLNKRLLSQFNRRLYEPAGQDGVSCLLLAVLDQLHDLELHDASIEMDAAKLRGLTVTWLVDNRDMIIADDWKQRGAAQSAELGVLHECGSEFSEFLEDEHAVGNHIVLLAICGVLSELFCIDFAAKVRASASN